MLERRGVMLVLSSPSGAGKTTIARELLSRDDKISMSVSTTTRPKRPGEVSGVDYHFVDKTEFNIKRNQQEFLESAKVFDNYYGTPAEPVMAALAEGMDILFDIDWQGTQQLAEKAPDDVVSVFILPPSHSELERRLNRRAQDTPEEVARRMSKAASELSHYAEYDYIIINNLLGESVMRVMSILTAERLKRRRAVGMSNFVKRLCEDG
ncbi:MAG: guanylate kinase [Rhodospirillaceae bacterium]|nr:guanylate kinase [Rhodospirillaceae bacterium]|tara:strand:+ start:151 stop:777 length:627 start_codon:yes stop_codon:yes gene_type:complete